MKKVLFLIILIAAFFFPVSMNSQQLAFPGAEGFGRYAAGARAVSAPEVYHVTNLNDSGTGSFRDAVSKSGRIVVFDVSGVIKMKSRIVFSGNSYIAGQTAPGDGIILYGNGVSFTGANNVIVRYLRIFMGKSGDAGKDAVTIANGSTMIFDHVSALWGLDENFSVNWDSKGTEPADITIQNCIIGQGIESHSCGGLIQTNGGVSILGCLYIDNKTRNPKVKGLNQFINNVVYNWGSGGGYIMGDSSGDSWAWIEGNYFINGPSNSSGAFVRANTNFQIYFQNNMIDANRDGVLNGSVANAGDYGATVRASLSAFTKLPKSHPDIAGGILTPEDALNKIIAGCGASLPVRTAVDEFLVDQLQTYGKQGVTISSETENGIYQNVGVVSSGSKALDSDGDGIPDWWETANGLNPNSASDATQKAANGYLNIENYINSIAGPTNSYVRCASKLAATARDINSITVSWRNNATESDAVIVQRSTNGTTFTDLATLAATATSYQDTGLDEDTPYYYRLVTKKSGLSDSTPSEVIKVSTTGTPRIPYESYNPSPATGDTTRFYTQVPFTWDNNTGPWAGNVTYDLYLGSSEDNLTCKASNLSSTAFTFENAGLTMKDTYYWRVDTKNDLGTTQGPVWKFTAGTYSFVSSYADVGRDFTGTGGSGSSSNAKSGTLLSSTTSYTINSGKTNEVIFSIGGGATMNTNTSNGVYQSSGNYNFMYLTADDTHYIEGRLTANSKNQLFANIKFNGTSSDLSNGSLAAVLFSNVYPFSTTSIIGYEEDELPPVRKGESAITVNAPVGTKSFRIYRKATISPNASNEDTYYIGGSYNTMGGSGNLRIAYVGATLELVSDDDTGENSINNPTANTNKIIYFDNCIYNTEQENVTIFNSIGVLVLTSKESHIDVQKLPSGFYIAKTKTSILKFTK